MFDLAFHRSNYASSNINLGKDSTTDKASAILELIYFIFGFVYNILL